MICARNEKLRDLFKPEVDFIQAANCPTRLHYLCAALPHLFNKVLEFTVRNPNDVQQSVVHGVSLTIP